MTTTITVLGFLIVAISVLGLVSTMTISVIERTREIGVLRAIGARAHDVRRIFAVEALALALLGWLLGVPLGWLMQPSNHQRHSVDIAGARREFISIPWSGSDANGAPRRYFIWGATAAMLRNLYRFLAA